MPAGEAGSGAAVVDGTIGLLGAIARLVGEGRDLDATLSAIARHLHGSTGHALVAFLEQRADGLHVRVAEGGAGPGGASLTTDAGTAAAAIREGRPALGPPVGAGRRVALPSATIELAVPIVAGGVMWGALLVADPPAGGGLADRELLAAIADQVAVAVANARLMAQVERQLHQAEALARIGADITSKLDLEIILGGLVDHALVLFAADRGAVYRRLPDGGLEAQVARNLSARFLQFVRRAPSPSLSAQVFATRRTDFAVDYANDPRGAGIREGVRQEGFDTIAVSPLFAGDEVLGLLALYHDRRHTWEPLELDTLDALAAQASIAIAHATSFAHATTWAAQLQSIQQLGVRLNRLSSVQEIGDAMALELRQLIEYHNVRVYLVAGDDVLPVAWHGEIGEYENELAEQLRLKVGQGITGWVAEHGVAQYLPDAERDPRVRTIAGTERIDESLLVAPMTFDDRVLGVIVLSKLGIDRFSSDDLRLLGIYASFAAQAVSNAAATEQLRAQSMTLERQLRSQRELLTITRSILTALDPRLVFDEIADRLGGLVASDNLVIDLHDPVAHRLQPVVARGEHADLFRDRALRDDEGLGGWVVQHGEPQLVPHERLDPRVRFFPATGVIAGALICVPLHGRAGIAGVLTLERLGDAAAFSEDEFELVQLFAAQASVALQNAEIHRATELRAQTDGLTGLANHVTFKEALAQAVAAGQRFSLLMVDLDDFKAHNDALGHQAGDRFLAGVARALESAGRGSDRVFRYGGDEFALILPGSDAAGALVVAERARAAIRDVSSTIGDGIATSPTSSTGIATFPDDGRTPAEVLLVADRACYVAKGTGRDQVVTAAGGALASSFELTVPTPVDEPAPRRSARRGHAHPPREGGRRPATIRR